MPNFGPGPAPYRPASGPAPYRPTPYRAAVPQPYRPAPYGPSYGPNQRRGGGGCGAAFAVVAIIGVLVLALISFLGDALLSQPGPSTTGQQTTSISTASTNQYNPTPTDTETPEPTPEPPPAPPASRQFPELGYVNDGYARPGVGGPEQPLPPTLQDAYWWRTDNTIYPQTMPEPVRCALPPIDTDAADDATLYWGLDAFLTCLMRAWDLPMQSSGDVLTTPSVYIISSDAVDTPCGYRAGFAGLYCSSNQSIYMARNTNRSVYNDEGWLTYAVERTFAHELGHHVQAMTGLLSSSWWVQQQLTGGEALLENRRRELQAQCFAGLAFAALGRGLGLTQADRDTFWEDEHRWADDTHGTSEHQAAWFFQGFNSLSISACNTWHADPGDLS